MTCKNVTEVYFLSSTIELHIKDVLLLAPLQPFKSAQKMHSVLQIYFPPFHRVLLFFD